MIRKIGERFVSAGSLREIAQVRDEYFYTYIAEHDAVLKVVWNLGRVVLIFCDTRSALSFAAVAAQRYRPPVAPCFLGAARLHAYMRDDPELIAVIVRVPGACCVLVFGVDMPRPETRFATARVFTGHWLPS